MARYNALLALVALMAVFGAASASISCASTMTYADPVPALCSVVVTNALSSTGYTSSFAYCMYSMSTTNTSGTVLLGLINSTYAGQNSTYQSALMTLAAGSAYNVTSTTSAALTAFLTQLGMATSSSSTLCSSSSSTTSTTTASTTPSTSSTYAASPADAAAAAAASATLTAATGTTVYSPTSTSRSVTTSTVTSTSTFDCTNANTRAGVETALVAALNDAVGGANAPGVSSAPAISSNGCSGKFRRFSRALLATTPNIYAVSVSLAPGSTAATTFTAASTTSLQAAISSKLTAAGITGVTVSVSTIGSVTTVDFKYNVPTVVIATTFAGFNCLDLNSFTGGAITGNNAIARYYALLKTLAGTNVLPITAGNSQTPAPAIYNSVTNTWAVAPSVGGLTAAWASGCAGSPITVVNRRKMLGVSTTFNSIVQFMPSAVDAAATFASNAAQTIDSDPALQNAALGAISTTVVSTAKTGAYLSARALASVPTTGTVTDPSASSMPAYNTSIIIVIIVSVFVAVLLVVGVVLLVRRHTGLPANMAAQQQEAGAVPYNIYYEPSQQTRVMAPPASSTRKMY